VTREPTLTVTGRTVDELTIEAVLAGDLTTQDFRISAGTLCRQAAAAEGAGYRQLAANLRRAAELTHLSNQEVLEIYDALRPGRASYDQLIGLAQRLEAECHAPLTAALVREAAEIYRERSIIT
jgi:propanediol dehydratase small subunit